MADEEVKIDERDLKYDWDSFVDLGGRPSKYSTDLALEICKYISGGIPLKAVCRRSDMPHVSTVLQWVVEDRKENEQDSFGFSYLYKKARESQGFYDADNIRDTVERALNGEIDASIARVAIDGMKWTAERNAGRTFGQKQEIDQKITGHQTHEHKHEHEFGNAVLDSLKNKHSNK